MQTYLYQISLDNGTTWNTMPTPSEYKRTLSDLDNSSYRSCVTGNLVRNRIAADWVKLEIGYNFLSDADTKDLRSKLKSNATFKVRCYCPEIGTINSPVDSSATWCEFIGYASDIRIEEIPAQIGNEVSFNIIQAKRGSWQ